MSQITENWCDFVLNEGIMPTNLVRELKNFNENGTKLCVLIADILSNQEIAEEPRLRISSKKTSVSEAFNSDPELVKWLNSVTELLYVIKTFVGKGDAFSGMVDEACLSFIKVCPLVSDERKLFYLGADSITDLPVLTDDQKQAFRNYLKECGYSFNTINSYISAVNIIGKLDNVGLDLWSIKNSEQIKQLYNELEANTEHLYDEYKRKDAEGRKTLSNALKRYMEFLNGKGDNMMYQNKNNPKEKIGHIVQTVFRNSLQSGNVSQYEIEQMQNMGYCKQIFRTRGYQYPILANEQRSRERYYKQPVKIGNKIYYISSQWYEEQLPYLKKWLENHGVNI